LGVIISRIEKERYLLVGNMETKWENLENKECGEQIFSVHS